MSILYHLREISKIHEEQRSKSVGGSKLSDRYSLLPIVDVISWEFYKKQETTMWSANELDFTSDVAHYDHKLTPTQRRAIELVLGFFAPGDGLISKNIVFRFIMEAGCYEELHFFIAQLMIELIHAETYTFATTALIRDSKKLQDIRNLVDTCPAMTAKAEWVEKYIFSDQSKSVRFLASACAEGLFFSVLFAVIFYFRSIGLMPNFILSNELISKDEGLHRDYGCYLYNKYKDSTNTREEAIQIITSAIETEIPFIELMLKVEDGDTSLGELTPATMTQYLKSISNNLLMTLGYESNPDWDVPNPYTWMDDICLTQKGNFFEVRIGAYAQSSFTKAVDWRSRVGLTTKIVDITDPDSVDF